MEDQVLIPRENAHYLLLILIIHIGAYFPSPMHSKLNMPDKGDTEAKFDVDYLTFPFIAVIKLAFSGGSFLFTLGESYTIKRHLYQAAWT